MLDHTPPPEARPGHHGRSPLSSEVRRTETAASRRAVIGAVLARADPITALAEARRNLRLMMRRFQIGPNQIPARFAPDLQAAERRCSQCAAIGRCQLYLLASADDDPHAFCPNAGLYDQIAAAQEAASHS